MKNETGIGWGILLVALIVGSICFYLGEATGQQRGYKTGYSTCQEEMEDKLEEEGEIAYGEGYSAGYYDALDGKPYED